MKYELGTSSRVGTTISKLATGLSSLPRVSETSFGERAPWAVISTRTLVATLGIDRGNFATWRCRGIGPAELPATWFRLATGRPNYYRIDAIEAWLAGRCGEPFDTKSRWFDFLDANLGEGFATTDWVRRLAEAEGPVQSDVRFTAVGWQAYLDGLILS
ncbi:hypothetical protein [Methylobacterium trifolii]|uniref:Uncharacterized protein n=1 Tax=Methylobacterium trifolii TaxID=1003092 RepID=A0ABQ4U6N3_9HYPH|nr:hypothetical protein [Methylobacterium trifolii]GJE62062.1 hypothetical protein MPOCJGCO_4191 [Methylobacterium trifolii]